MDSGDHDDGHFGIAFLGLFEQADAVEFGHHQVGEHELEFFAGVEDSERFQAGTRLFAVISGHREHGGHNFANRLFVIDDQNPI